MQITIIAGGSRGDVQPYVALGAGLKEARHAVRLLTSDDFHGLITDYGLDFFSTGGSAEAVAREMQGLAEQGHMLKVLRRMGQASRQQAIQAARQGLLVCEGSDLILGGLGGLYSGLALSEKLGIPFIPAYLVPFTPTSAFPATLTPLPQTAATSWLNRPSHHLTQQMMWQSFRTADRMAREQVLHLPAAPCWGPFATLERRKRPTLYGYSQQVVPRPEDWDTSQHVTGYWFLEPPAGWEPPTELLNFLQAGPPPVYVGFGSMSSRRPEESADIVLQVLERTGRRGVLYAGWGGLSKEQLPSHVHMTDSVPHSWLFPRMAAVVHHGGVGTTAAGLAAGIPSIVVPFFADQPFWGRRVHQLGVGPRPIARRRLSVDNLTRALEQALSDQTMREKAAELGERIRTEDGIAHAISIIETQFAP
ncbi:hypothetical protein KDH_73720 [Dictyobacter sp. S3.2.2.5]|uniref:Glycosyl transferase n=1 Tax=Dictyobacter halimunensis TaxID=3026934 RepID=A0ABQ6G6W0_9CHLR|nr:hypothetical protein KDH_73720 [Dictyobacter sp. S3.2.2.5]